MKLTAEKTNRGWEIFYDGLPDGESISKVYKTKAACEEAIVQAEQAPGYDRQYSDGIDYVCGYTYD